MDKKKKTYNVLVVEKEFIIGFDLTQSLRQHGFEVFYKNDNRAAVKFVKKETPDFLVVDRSMLKGICDVGELSQKDGIAILNENCRLLAYFEKPFFVETAANFLNEYIKGLGED